VTVYRPKEGGINDGDNEHFLVFESSKGDLLAMWTQSSVEGRGDNHIVLARSRDRVKWDAPREDLPTGGGPPQSAGEVFQAAVVEKLAWRS
jgi:hypothetical protein